MALEEAGLLMLLAPTDPIDFLIGVGPLEGEEGSVAVEAVEEALTEATVAEQPHTSKAPLKAIWEAIMDTRLGQRKTPTIRMRVSMGECLISMVQSLRMHSIRDMEITKVRSKSR